MKVQENLKKMQNTDYKLSKNFENKDISLKFAITNDDFEQIEKKGNCL